MSGSMSEGENAREMMEISDEALKFMEDYLGYSIEEMNNPILLGLERHCIPYLRELAQSVFEDKCERKLLRIKGEPIKENEWDRKQPTYFNGSERYNFFPWDFSRKSNNTTSFKARAYFQNHSKELSTLFISEIYGDMVNAIIQTRRFTQIIKRFVAWFNERREKFLENMSTAIAEVKKFQMSEKPQSHGGVANLLKVLTKNPQRYIELNRYRELPTGDNFWYGTTVTDPNTAYMGQDGFYEFHTFLSVEPMLADFGELSEKTYIPEWIIVGAETGNRKDKVIPRREWIENIVEQCRKYNIPVFMKPSLADIWGEELIQEFPEALIHA